MTQPTKAASAKAASGKATSARRYPAKRDPSRCPTHPGELLRDEVLPALGLGVSEAATALKVTRQTLHRILAQESAVSPGMALRLGKLIGNGPTIWLGMQNAFDLWHEERSLVDTLAAIKPAKAA
jgi:antitoxin HigA-1